MLGTAALLAAGEGKRPTAVGRALSIRPAVVIGDWSYSLYLWHWPVIVLLGAYLGPARVASVPVRLATLALIFALTYASYRWVETPFRHGTWRRRSRALLIYPVAWGWWWSRARLGPGRRLTSSASSPTAADLDSRLPKKELGKDPYVELVRASVLAAEQGRRTGDLTPGPLDLRAQ